MRLREHDVTLSGPRLSLRPMTEGDWDVLLPWNQDPEVLHFADSEPRESHTLDEVQDIYRSVSQQAYNFIFEYAGRPIGEGWLQRMNLTRLLGRHPGQDLRRIDLLIGEKELWGQGLGTEAIGLLTRFGFERQGADRVYACGVADYNPRSRQAFRKCGYEVCAVLPAKQPAKMRYALDLSLTRERFTGGRGPVRVLDAVGLGLETPGTEMVHLPWEGVAGPESWLLEQVLPDFEICCLATPPALAPASLRRARLIVAENAGELDLAYLHDHGLRLELVETDDMPRILRQYLEERL